MARPTIAASASGMLKARRAPNSDCNPCGDLEDAALAFHLGQVLLAAAIGHVLAEGYDQRVAAHLLMQRGVDQVDHGLGLAVELGGRTELVRGGIDLIGVQVAQGGIARGRIGVQSLLGGVVHFAVDLQRDAAQRVLVEHAFVQQKLGKALQRIARLLGLALGGSLVVPLVVGERMRVRPDHVGVHQRGAAPLTAVLDSRFHGRIGRQEIATIHFLLKEAGEAGHQRRNAGAGGLVFHRNRDSVAVIFDQEQNGQAVEAGGVQGFPKLALAGGAFAAGDQGDGIALGLRIAIGVRRSPPRAGIACRCRRKWKRC